MPDTIDVESILHKIDNSCQTCKDTFQTVNQDLIKLIEQLFNECTQCLIDLSKSVDGSEQVTQNRINAERIVTKLKELKTNLGNLWPVDLNSFKRDIFNVDEYRVETDEYFVPVPFYPGNNFLMKLYQWSVYDSDNNILHRYFLERSEIIPGEQYNVLGKSYSNAHSQLQPYGSTVPDYNQMKNTVIKDIIGQGSSPIISLQFQSSDNADTFRF